jgi:hypothetical protein
VDGLVYPSTRSYHVDSKEGAVRSPSSMLLHFVRGTYILGRGHQVASQEVQWLSWRCISARQAKAFYLTLIYLGGKPVSIEDATHPWKQRASISSSAGLGNNLIQKMFIVTKCWLSTKLPRDKFYAGGRITHTRAVTSFYLIGATAQS